MAGILNMYDINFLHTGYVHLRFYPGIEILILSMIFYPGCHVRTVHWLYWNSRTRLSNDINVYRGVKFHSPTCIGELTSGLGK